MTSSTCTGIDAAGAIPGYFDCAWPPDWGGPRRKKTARSAGLKLGPGERLVSTPRTNGEWNVMFIQRRPGELYVMGTNMPGSAERRGWVEQVDPITLQTIARTVDLPSGGHTWCGAIVAHQNGDLYSVNGRFLHRLNAALEVIAERELPVDGPYNGVLIMPDGNLLTKDLRLREPNSRFAVLEPDLLRVTHELELPEPSMGRIAAEPGERTAIITPGTEHVFRLVYERGRLALDDTWRPVYRKPGGDHGLAWDSCIGGGSVWLMDNGDTPAVHQIHSTYPVGASRGGAQRETTSAGAERLLRINFENAADVTEVAPFDAPNGWVVAPPVFIDGHDVAVAYDTGNARMAAYRWRGERLERMWEGTVTNFLQPMVFGDTAELIVDDFRGADGDDIVVLDLLSGEERGRCATGAALPNGMFLAPGWHRDLYYCTFGVIARIAVMEA
jgi:hypothetical protein